jgi:hypothetical protein
VAAPDPFSSMLMAKLSKCRWLGIVDYKHIVVIVHLAGIKLILGLIYALCFFSFYKGAIAALQCIMKNLRDSKKPAVSVYHLPVCLYT